MYYVLDIPALSDVLWNAFLAIIPVAAAYLLVRLCRHAPRQRAGALPYCELMVALGVIWLFFLPNTCYLLTEWRHYLNSLAHSTILTRLNTHDNRAMGLLGVLSLAFLSYSLFGLFTFALGIRPIARLLKRYSAHYWLLGIPFFFCMSLGVYLGLIHRFNSWDLLQRPAAVLQQSAQALFRPLTGRYILAFSLVLWIGYYLFDIWIDGFCLRFAALRRDRTPAGQQR